MTDFLDDQELNDLEGRKIQRLLAEEKECPLPAERLPWRRLALCYSSIAFAVVIEPDNGLPSDGERDQAKLSLYRYLKRIQLTLLESGLVYPLVCIAVAEQGTTAHAEMSRWMSDQDWHRGDFTLYVEPTRDRAKDRLRDLLSLKVEGLMDERREPRTIGYHIGEFGALLPQSGNERDLGQIILDIWGAYEENGRFGDDDGRTARRQIQDWIAGHIEVARREAEGRAS